MLKISNKPRTFVNVTIKRDSDIIVYRTSTKLSDLIKNGISDGFNSSTGIYDDVQGDPPLVFDPKLDKLDLADALLRQGAGVKTASNTAEKGVEV